MDFRKAGSALCILWISGFLSGCATTRSDDSGYLSDENVRSFAEAYRHSKEVSASAEDLNPSGRLTLTSSLGTVVPYLPVVKSPKVVRAWVPPHMSANDKGVLISGHWAFIMIEDAGWGILNERPASFKVPVIVPSFPRES
jgi:hypothetical protein